MNDCGIYSITHSVSGLTYIGQSRHIKHRWCDHRYRLKNNISRNPKLQAYWNKYGEEAFNFNIIEICHPDILNDRETYWMRFHKTMYYEDGFNIQPVGNSPDPALVMKDRSLTIDYGGLSLTLSDWSAKVNIRVPIIYTRIYRYGWTVGQALGFENKSKKNGPAPKLYLYKGEYKDIYQLAKLCNMKPHTINTRLNQGWTIIETIGIPKGKHNRRLKN